jgi:glycosyltransferase involved in cell wall biosynthesis
VSGAASGENCAVSVVIPCYNCARYLGDAIQGVLNQRYGASEIIVVDDGSTDSTPQVMASFGDTVRCIRQKNAGLAAARNAGIRAARGKFVALLDADDVWLPEYLATMVPAFGTDVSIGAAYCGWVYIDTTGVRQARRNICVVPREHMYAAMTRMDFLIPSAVVVRRDCFAQLGPFDETLKHGCEDWDMWLRLLTRYAMVGVSRALVQYRIHGENMSANFERLELAKRCVVAKHFGSDERRTVAHRRAYGGLYLSSAYAHLERGGIDQARHALERAFTLYPEMTAEVDTFYQLALAHQPVGSRGVFETLDLEVGTRNVLQALDAVFASRSSAAELRPYRLQAYGNAYLALGLLAYGRGDLRAARAFLLDALRCQGSLKFRRPLLSTLLKTCLGHRLLGRLKHYRACFRAEAE